MPPIKLDSRVIEDLCDVVEARVLEKIQVELRSKMALMKSDIITEIISSIGGVP